MLRRRLLECGHCSGCLFSNHTSLRCRCGLCAGLVASYLCGSSMQAGQSAQGTWVWEALLPAWVQHCWWSLSNAEPSGRRSEFCLGWLGKAVVVVILLLPILLL